jgi:hypothetical protein
VWLVPWEEEDAHRHLCQDALVINVKLMGQLEKQDDKILI